MGSSTLGATTKTWAVWLGGTVASFAALEAYAVSSRRVPTLTAALRCWLGFDPLKRRRHILAVLFALTWSWLVAHVIGGTGPNLEDVTVIAPPAYEADDLTTYERRQWR